MTAREASISRGRLIVYSGIPFVCLSLLTLALVWEAYDQFREDATLLWSWILPSSMLITILMGVLFLRPVFLADPVPSHGGERKQLFRYENRIVKFCAIGMFVCLAVSQPIVDHVVMPIIGYEYCEARTEYGPTFGFAFYVYVPDPALCVARKT